MYMQACIADYVTQKYENPEITRLWSRNQFMEVVVQEFRVSNHEVGNELNLSCGQ